MHGLFCGPPQLLLLCFAAPEFRHNFAEKCDRGDGARNTVFGLRAASQSPKCTSTPHKIGDVSFVVGVQP